MPRSKTSKAQYLKDFAHEFSAALNEGNERAVVLHRMLWCIVRIVCIDIDIVCDNFRVGRFLERRQRLNWRLFSLLCNLMLW
jgi:hypothetical protein